MAERFGTGVQTGADGILLLEPDVVRRKKLELSGLRAVLKGRDVRRYDSQSGGSIVFPYSDDDGQWRLWSEFELRRHKALFAYLMSNKEQLAERRWFGKRRCGAVRGFLYGLMYLDDPWTFGRPHLLTPSLSHGAEFAVGRGDFFLTGTAGVTSVVLKAGIKENIPYLLSAMNLELLSKYVIEHSPVYQGQYHKFSKPYIEHVPVRRVDYASRAEVARHNRLVEWSARLAELYSERRTLRGNEERGDNQRQRLALEAEVDAKCSLFTV